MLNNWLMKEEPFKTPSQFYCPTLLKVKLATKLSVKYVKNGQCNE